MQVKQLLNWSLLWCTLLIFDTLVDAESNGSERHRRMYKGKLLGKFPPGSLHSVTGTVYAVNDNTLYIENFSYDGSAPDAFFWAGSTPQPSTNGFIIPDSLGRRLRLKAYRNQNVLLQLPDGRTLKDIRWIAIWCRIYTANFGHIMIPISYEAPKPVNLGRLPSLAHSTRADAVIIRDAKTIEIRRLFYDGAAPDAFFLVGTGPKPHQAGVKVPDERGSLLKLHGYNGQNLVLRLPDEVTIYDIDWFALFCITYNENFGHVMIPKTMSVPADLVSLATTVITFANCETIFPNMMQVSWEVREPEIYFQLEGKVAPDQYLSFGLSGSHERPQMIGADVAVAFYDSQTGRAMVVDYILNDKSQCNPQATSGACPDHTVSGGRQNLELVSWGYNNGILTVVYKRLLDTVDEAADQIIAPEMKATIVGAIGSINTKKEAAYHKIRYTKSTDTPLRIAFARKQDRRNCENLIESSAATASSVTAKVRSGWNQAVIEGQTTFRAQIGPSGGSRGYTAITGIQSWGIAWWINGHLIPELKVVRGKSYTFVVEGGNNPAMQGTYHPLYITNNVEGGGGQSPDSLNTPGHRVYAGVSFINGVADPSPGAGRYCEWKHRSGIDQAESSPTFEKYKKTLRLECEPGNPAVFVWTPDDDTPDVVYYQCFTHRNLGWKIIVTNTSRALKASPIFLIVLIMLRKYLV